MNRLDLVRRLIAESGTTGLALGTTLNQKGDALNFVNWVDDAWLEIQGLMNWPSLWEGAQVTIPASSSARAPWSPAAKAPARTRVAGASRWAGNTGC